MKKAVRFLIGLAMICVILTGAALSEEIAFSDFFLSRLTEIEQGPIYLPFGSFRGTTYVYDLELQDGRTIDSAKVEWISGSDNLKNLYKISHQNNGEERWMLSYQSNDYGGTGTAAFRITAYSGSDEATADFTVTVTELDEAEQPKQNKTNVEIDADQTVNLAQLGIVDNPSGFEELYFIINENSSSTLHGYEDAEGERYALKDGILTSQDEGTYSAFVQVKPSYNLTASFPFTILVKANGEPPAKHAITAIHCTAWHEQYNYQITEARLNTAVYLQLLDDDDTLSDDMYYTGKYESEDVDIQNDSFVMPDHPVTVMAVIAKRGTPVVDLGENDNAAIDQTLFWHIVSQYYDESMEPLYFGDSMEIDLDENGAPDIRVTLGESAESSCYLARLSGADVLPDSYTIEFNMNNAPHFTPLKNCTLIFTDNGRPKETHWLNVQEGQTVILPDSDVSGKIISVKSDNPQIAAVNPDSSVSASGFGMTTLRVTYENGSGTYDFRVWNEPVLILPEKLVTLEEEAFDGAFHSHVVQFGPNVRSIGKNAFRDAQVMEVIITSPDTEFDREMFSDKYGFTVLCPKGSKAEESARKNHIDWAYLKY